MLTIKIISTDINKGIEKKYNGRAYLLEVNQDGIVRYFVASGVNVLDLLNKNIDNVEMPEAWKTEMKKTNEKLTIGNGWEILVFPSNEKGDMLSATECAGGKEITYRQAIEDLKRNIRKYGIHKVWKGAMWNDDENNIWSIFDPE